ncbi:MAG: class I adenylate-forming enzyme family protein, partial [Candidatus Moraniibacteriota bacterium]
MKATSPAENLHSFFASAAKNNPEKIALLSCAQDGLITEEISYGRLAEKIEDAAAYLLGLGLRKDSRIALAFSNSTELLILSWAAWSIGIVTVPLDVKHDTSELYRYKIALNHAKLLIIQDKISETIDRDGFSGIKIEIFSALPRTAIGNTPWADDLSHLALILFTSGTTGYPKGAKLSLQNLVVNANGIRHWLRIEERDRFLVNLPLHHINSTTFCLATLLSGGSIAIPPAYSNSNFWHQAAATRTTFTSIVQSIVHDQLSRESEYASVKKELLLNRIQIGSAPVIAQSVFEFHNKYHIPLYQGYGQTETSLRVTGVPMDLSANLYQEMIEANSIGIPMPWADLQIADDAGVILNENEEGELIVAGAAVMDGYVGGEPAFRDGYFLTGDIGLFKILEGRRFFLLKGRKKEIIIKGGVNISPSAVENSLKKISADIDQAYVISVTDDRYGEEVAAAICWKPGVDIENKTRHLKLLLLSESPHISTYETPRYITSIASEKLPMTSTGKVQRTVLKKQLPPNQFELIQELLKTDHLTFSLLVPHSPRIHASYQLYHQCWQPLTVDEKQYEKNIAKHFVLIATERNGNIAGQITLLRTDLGSDRLLCTPASRLLTSDSGNQHGNTIVCFALCLANFHCAPQSVVLRGAEFVGIVPDDCPEERHPYGQTLLLKYPRASTSTG